MYDIAVIVPVFNGEKTIKRCIDSILNQKLKNFKVYVVNNASTDKTSQVLQQYATSRVEILDTKIKGASAARNTALEIISSKYVTFVDADDYVDKDYLGNLYRGIMATDADMSISGIRILSEDDNLIDCNSFKRQIFSSKQAILEVLKEEGPQGFLWNKLFKTEIIKKYGLRLDTQINMAEDLLFCVEYMMKVKKVAVLDTVDYNYVQYSNSLSYTANMQNTSDSYIIGYSDYISALLKIQKLVCEYDKQIKIEVGARVCRACEDFLRTMRLNGFSNKEEIRNVKKVITKNLKYIVISRQTKLSRKLNFIVALWMPDLELIMDRKRFRKNED